MVTINLDPRQEDRLREMAISRGQEVAEFARRIVEQYIEHLDWSDSDADWAEASVAMSSEVLTSETWPNSGDECRRIASSIATSCSP
jgi:hypothetical protein